MATLVRSKLKPGWPDDGIAGHYVVESVELEACNVHEPPEIAGWFCEDCHSFFAHPSVWDLAHGQGQKICRCALEGEEGRLVLVVAKFKIARVKLELGGR
jgi:hypothetical protein